MLLPETAGQDEGLAAALAAAGDLAYDWDLATGGLAWRGPPGSLGLPDFGALGDAVALRALIEPEDLAARQYRLERHLAAGEPYACEYRLRLPGGPAWVQDRGAAARDAAGRPVRLRGILRVASGVKEAERRLELLANFDPLTGHFNKARLREAIAHLVEWERRRDGAGAYLVLGLDNLTMLNDAFGHDAADSVIVEVGRRLDRCLGLTDVIGRVGGDRFGILIGRCEEAAIAATAERILAAVSQAPVPTVSGPVYVTASIGSIAFPAQAEGAIEIMSRAETALAAAKRAGRDCCARYRLSEEDRAEHRAGMAMGERVQKALKESRLVFAYQPVVGSDSGTVDYYECLLRMIDEDGAIVAAGAFVPAVERLGFIRTIDRHVLMRAIEEAAANSGVRLGLNVSAITASDGAWLHLAQSLLKDEPEIARRLVVEITETAALAEFGEMVGFVTALRELGCRVALDDFGAGFTSLRHLQSLAIDLVKIDGSFVRHLAESPEDQRLLRHLVGLADGFGLATVAECVERPEDVAILRREGVGFMQGYHFGRPSIVRPWLGAVDGAARAASTAQTPALISTIAS